MQTRPPNAGQGDNTTVRIPAQNASDFQEVVARALPSLYRMAYRHVGNPHDAEDAVQDALLSAYTHLEQFKGTAKLTTWLTSIVTNSALNQLRKRARRPSVFFESRLDEGRDQPVLEGLADSRPSPESESIQAQLHGQLLQSVTKLKPPLRVAIQLRDLGGMSTSEVARILDVPEGTIKTRISRARAALRQSMCGE